jgi:hypothetical protein
MLFSVQHARTLSCNALRSFFFGYISSYHVDLLLVRHEIESTKDDREVVLSSCPRTARFSPSFASVPFHEKIDEEERNYECVDRTDGWDKIGAWPCLHKAKRMLGMISRR